MAWDKRADEILGTDITDILEKNDISVYDVSEDGSKNYTIGLEFYSDAGEDFCFELEIYDKDDFADEFRDYAKDFDVNEHIAMWLGSSGRGVPDAETVVKDANNIKEFLLNVSMELDGEELDKFKDVEVTISKEAIEKLVECGKLDIGNAEAPEMIADAITEIIEFEYNEYLEQEAIEAQYGQVEAYIKEQLSKETYGKNTIDVSPVSYDDKIGSETMRGWFESYQEMVQNDLASDYPTFEDYFQHQAEQLMEDRIFELERDLADEIGNKVPSELREAFESYTADMEYYEILEEGGYEGVSFDAKDFLQEYYVNLMFGTENEQNWDMTSIQAVFTGDNLANYNSKEFEQGFDNALSYLIHQQGYKISDVLNEMKNPSEKSNETTFVQSVVNELNEFPQYSMSELTVLTSGKKELLDVLDNIAHGKDYISFSQGTSIGLFNEWQGTGSALEIQLEKPAVFPANMIRNVQFESTGRDDTVSAKNYECSVDSVYGLIKSEWSKSDMSATAEKPELVQESIKDLQAQLKSETQKEKAIKKGQEEYNR